MRAARGRARRLGEDADLGDGKVPAVRLLDGRGTGDGGQRRKPRLQLRLRRAERREKGGRRDRAGRRQVGVPVVALVEREEKRVRGGRDGLGGRMLHAAR